MKKKFADRADWRRVKKRAYAQAHIETEEFTGHIALFRIDRVKEPLFVHYRGKRMCIADEGYMWLQQFPTGQLHSVTCMFNSRKEIVQWYIDVCQPYELDSRNVPWYNDLYLDIIVLPSGEVIQKDADELEAALSQGAIDEQLYNQAWAEARRLNGLITKGKFHLLELSKRQLDMLIEKL